MKVCTGEIRGKFFRANAAINFLGRRLERTAETRQFFRRVFVRVKHFMQFELNKEEISVHVHVDGRMCVML